MEPEATAVFMIYAPLAPEYSGGIDRDKRVDEPSSNQGGMPVAGARAR